MARPRPPSALLRPAWRRTSRSGYSGTSPAAAPGTYPRRSAETLARVRTPAPPWVGPQSRRTARSYMLPPRRVLGRSFTDDRRVRGGGGLGGFASVILGSQKKPASRKAWSAGESSAPAAHAFWLAG